jgi:hypothetical protein
MPACKNEVLAKRLCHALLWGPRLRFRFEQPVSSNEQTEDSTASLVGHMAKVGATCRDSRRPWKSPAVSDRMQQNGHSVAALACDRRLPNNLTFVRFVNV